MTAAEQFGLRQETLLFIFSAIAALGLLGNVVSMVVWTRPQLKSSSAVLLTALAACDFLILLSVNTLSYSIVLKLNYNDSPAIEYAVKFIIPYVQVCCAPVFCTAQTVSIYLTLGIALERYIAVRRPFEARLVCTYRRACWYAATVITVSILYNLIAFMDKKVVARVDDNGDITSYSAVDTELSQSPLFRSIYRLYNTWLRLILNYLLPFICIAVLNTIIHLELKRAEKRRQTMTFCQRKENRLTWMLFYVVAEFLVCSLVQILYLILITFHLPYKPQWYADIIFPLAIFSETCNSSSNFLTYVLFGRSFREALLSSFTCCRGLRSQKRSNGTDDRELDVKRPEIPN